jgi:hypothetical protein
MLIHPTDPLPTLRLLRNLRAVCAQARQRGDVPTARAALDEEESLNRRIAELEKQVPTDETPDQKEAA